MGTLLDKEHKCEHCGRVMNPCPVPTKNGEQRFVGLFPCPCKNPIGTDMGVVYPGDEVHTMLLNNKNYSINDILTKER